VGYVRLPDMISKRVHANFINRRLGTQYLDESGQKRHGSLANIYE
jgi:hypothetical protein